MPLFWNHCGRRFENGIAVAVNETQHFPIPFFKSNDSAALHFFESWSQ